ncbi:MAG: site-specific integrase, partial [Bacteroidales bacterium]|nr:site-specific integrase [Bacteroidales bacterium]
MKKKRVRTDNTYLISSDDTENPKLLGKVLKSGRDSLFLDWYFGYDRNTGAKNRRRETLKGLYLYTSPKSESERTHNKQTLALAKRIRNEKEQAYLKDTEGYCIAMAENGVAFVDLCSDYLAERDRSSISQYGQIKMAVTQYKRFAEKEGITHYKVKTITR